MGFSAYYNESNLSKTSNLSNYATDTLGGEVRWVFPVGRFEALRLSLGYDQTRLKVDQPYAAKEINDFINRYGNEFNEFIVGTGWSHDSLDQRLFPKKGISQTLDFRVVVPGARQQYYKAYYEAKSYYPISDSELWIGNLIGNVGYANGFGKTKNLPFYRNYTAGGTRFVRGFEENSLGPKTH